MHTDLDSTLASKVREYNDESALKELISRHSGIYIDMIKKFGSKSLSISQISDIIQEKDYNIYKAAIEYNEDLSKFSTYLANKTKYICLTQKTNNFKNKRLVNFDEIDFIQKSSASNPDEECLLSDSFNRVITMLLKHDDNRVKTIFHERYFCGEKGKLKPWKEIADILNLSAQGCINIHNKIIKEFKNKIKDEKIKF
jgi:RNA polymerase sigma factor (sigma-70 family)